MSVVENFFSNASTLDLTYTELRRWIDQEKARVNAEDAALRQNFDQARLDRLRADRGHLNQQIDRYNLMVVYPDGR